MDSKTYVFEGKTSTEAIEKGLKELNVSKNKVDIKVNDPGNGYSYIETGSENEAAINLYKKLDYEIIDNFGYFQGDDLCICMKKEFKSLIF